MAACRAQAYRRRHPEIAQRPRKPPQPRPLPAARFGSAAYGLTAEAAARMEEMLATNPDLARIFGR